MVETAMVLAAGLGTRLRAVSGDLPKPMVAVANRPLLDHTLDNLSVGGVSRAVVNVHYKADAIEAHLAGRRAPAITISDERGALLNTGGGARRALPLLASDRFFCTNTDAIFERSALHPCAALRDAWRAGDGALLLLVRRAATSGYQGAGDFHLAADGTLDWRSEGTAHVYSGLQLLSAELLSDLPGGSFPMRTIWDHAAAQGRFRGVLHEGGWLHVGDPEGHVAAEARLADQ